MDKLIEIIAEAMDDKRGKNILSLDITKFDGTICDAFVVCSGESTTQVCAIADGIEDAVQKECGEKVIRKEGMDNGLWVAMDYGNVMVHVFLNEMRDFYALEDMWGDADLTRYEFE